MSNIDPTVPTQGVDNSSQKLRDNFAAAAAEIDALDGRVGELEMAAGGGPILDVEVTGTLTVDGTADLKGPVTLGADPTSPAQAATKNYVDAALVSAAGAMFSPADPAGTTSAAYRMMGLGGTLTPSRNSRILITVDGQIQNSSNAQQTSAVMVVGTGTPPVNGALQAGNGTIIGAPARFEASSNSSPFVPFSLTALLSGITAGTAYWIDLAVSVTGGTGTVFDLNLTAVEIL